MQIQLAELSWVYNKQPLPNFIIFRGACDRNWICAFAGEGSVIRFTCCRFEARFEGCQQRMYLEFTIYSSEKTQSVSSTHRIFEFIFLTGITDEVSYE